MVRTKNNFQNCTHVFIILSENCLPSEGELTVLLGVLTSLVEGFIVGQKV